MVEIWDVLLDKNDWFLSVNGTYWRKLGGLRSSDMKHEDDEKVCAEHVQERWGGGPSIIGGGGGK